MPTTYPDLTTLLAGIAARITENSVEGINGTVHQLMDQDMSRSLWANADKKVQGPVAAVPDGNLMAFDGTPGKLAKDGGVIGGAAHLNVGVVTNTVAAGDDPRFASLPAVANTVWLKTTASKTGKGTFDLGDVYGLSNLNGSMKLAQLYTQSDAAAKFPRLFQWFAAAGWSNATIMQIRHFPACHNDALLWGHPGPNWGTGRINSRNNITWPAGLYHHNIASFQDAGIYLGQGTQSVYGDTNGTTLIMDKAGWLADALLPFNLLSTTTGPSDYVEGTFTDQVRLEGGCDFKAHDTSYESNGIYANGAGENYAFGTMRITGFNGHGIKTTGGTPLSGWNLSVFSNTIAAIGMYGGVIGGALSTNNFGTISCDDNPTIFKMLDAGGNRSGGTVNVGLIKAESGKRTPNRGQILIEGDGFTGPNSNEGCNANLTVANMQYDMSGVHSDRTHALAVLRGFQPGLLPGDYTSPREARIHIGSVKHWHFDYWMHDLGTRRQWAADQDYNIGGFTWNAQTGLLTRDAADGATPTVSARLGTRRLGVKGTEPNWDAVAPYDETFGGTITPDPAFTQLDHVCMGVVPSQIHVGATAQGFAQAVDQDHRLRPDTATWSIVTGGSLATINSSTGVITATGAGLVQIRAFCGTNNGYTWLNIIP